MKRALLIVLWALAAGCVAVPPTLSEPPAKLRCVAVESLDNGETWEIWERADGSRYIKAISPSGRVWRMDIDNVVYMDEPGR